MTPSAARIFVIAERSALAWILTESRIAFPARSAEQARVLVPGDALFLYTTRGCFHNPTRDRGRIIGEARVASAVTQLPDPVRFGDRLFPIGCAIHVDTLAPRGDGLELAPLVEALRAFPNKSSWSAWMRRTLIPLNGRDVVLVRRGLRALEPPSPVAVATYLHSHTAQ